MFSVDKSLLKTHVLIVYAFLHLKGHQSLLYIKPDKLQIKFTIFSKCTKSIKSNRFLSFICIETHSNQHQNVVMM